MPGFTGTFSASNRLTVHAPMHPNAPVTRNRSSAISSSDT